MSRTDGVQVDRSQERGSQAQKPREQATQTGLSPDDLAARIRYLQRTAGNQAVNQLLRQYAVQREAQLAAARGLGVGPPAAPDSPSRRVQGDVEGMADQPGPTVGQEGRLGGDSSLRPGLNQPRSPVVSQLVARAPMHVARQRPAVESGTRTAEPVDDGTEQEAPAADRVVSVAGGSASDPPDAPGGSAGSSQATRSIQRLKKDAGTAVAAKDTDLDEDTEGKEDAEPFDGAQDLKGPATGPGQAGDLVEVGQQAADQGLVDFAQAGAGVAGPAGPGMAGQQLGGLLRGGIGQQGGDQAATGAAEAAGAGVAGLLADPTMAAAGKQQGDLAEGKDPGAAGAGAGGRQTGGPAMHGAGPQEMKAHEQPVAGSAAGDLGQQDTQAGGQGAGDLAGVHDQKDVHATDVLGNATPAPAPADAGSATGGTDSARDEKGQAGAAAPGAQGAAGPSGEHKQGGGIGTQQSAVAHAGAGQAGALPAVQGGGPPAVQKGMLPAVQTGVVGGAGPGATGAANPTALAGMGAQGGGAAGGGHSARLEHVRAQVHQAAQVAQTHAPAGHLVGAAQAAAPSPANEAASTAQALQSGAMHSAQPGKPNKESFLALLRSKLAEIAPKSNQELKDFKQSGKADQLRGELGQGVKTQNQAAQSQIAGATKAEPPTGQVPPREPGPPPPPPQPAAVPPIDGAQAVPPPAPDPSPALAQQNQAADQKMAENKITPQQLQKANDPRFTAVNDARDQMHANAQAAPAQFQAQQQGIIANTQAAAQAAATAAHTEMKAAHGKAHAQAHGHQQAVMEKDAAARKKVADDIQAKYQATKDKVEAKLKELDEPIDKLFEDGEKAAREQFEQNIDRRTTMELVTNPGMALVGWLTGWDPVMRAIWDDEHTHYMQAMDAVLVQVADKVEQGLAQAKAIIDEGHADIEKYVSELPANLRASGQQAEQQVDNQFKELEHEVDAKRDALASHLAERYQQAQKDIDDRMKELEESHRGLVGAFMDKLNAVIEAVKMFKQKLAGIVQNAEETIDLIMEDPIAFLNHLLDTLKKGFGKFLDNIWTHLKKGLIGWLTGALSTTGITLPETWDLKGIAMLVLQILGFTWEHVESILTEIIGPQAMKVVKKVIDYVKTLLNGGIEGLWEQIKGDLGGLKDMVFGAIQDWLVTTVVKVAIEKLVMLSNPAGAIVEAIEDIYKTVMFFIEKAQQIATLVETIVNSVHKIAQGDIEDAANWIEKTMADTIPVILGFLADLLGLGGISETIAGLIKKAKDFIWNPIKAALRALYEKAKSALKGLFGGDKDGKDGEHGPDERTDQQKQQSLEGGMAEVSPLLQAENATVSSIKERLSEIKSKHKMTSLELTVTKQGDEKEEVQVRGAIDQQEKSVTGSLKAGDVKEKVRRELQSALTDEVEGEEQVQSVLSTVYNKYQPEGLKLLHVVPIDGKPEEFEIHAVASPGERVKVIKAKPNITLSNVIFKFGTQLAANVESKGQMIWAEKYNVEENFLNEEDNSHHAEEAMLFDLLHTWFKWEQTGMVEKGHPVTVHMDITRTPCSKCANNLTEFVGTRKGYGYDLILDVRALSFYKGRQGNKSIAESEKALEKLLAAGHKITPLDVLDELALPKDGVKDATIEQIQRRLDDLRDRLAKIPQAKAGSGA